MLGDQGNNWLMLGPGDELCQVLYLKTLKFRTFFLTRAAPLTFLLTALSVCVCLSVCLSVTSFLTRAAPHTFLLTALSVCVCLSVRHIIWLRHVFY